MIKLSDYDMLSFLGLVGKACAKQPKSYHYSIVWSYDLIIYFYIANILIIIFQYHMEYSYIFEIIYKIHRWQFMIKILDEVGDLRDVNLSRKSRKSTQILSLSIISWPLCNFSTSHIVFLIDFVNNLNWSKFGLRWFDQL